MKIVDILKSSKTPSFAFEIVPSLSGSSLRDTLETVEYLKPVKPAWINITTHSQNSGEVCGAIQQHFHIPTVAHLLCRGVTPEQIDESLEELNSMGVQNVLLLQGEGEPAPGDKNIFAADLVKQVSYSAFNFCIGVAGYPEKHFAAADLRSDIENLKRKVDCGAHYILTQMFFDNEVFFGFVEKCRAAGIQVPIVPGLRVLQSVAQLEAVPKRFYCTVPASLAEGMLANPEKAAEVGCLWAESQARELINNGFSALQFFVLQDKKPVKQVVDALAALTIP
jgi:methylenetetrahydrofolate reductase (NADPH)